MPRSLGTEAQRLDLNLELVPDPHPALQHHEQQSTSSTTSWCNAKGPTSCHLPEIAQELQRSLMTDE